MTGDEFTIDKSIPIPPPTRGPKANGFSKYPFSAMEVGDSFFVGDKKSRHINCYFKKFRPKRFTSRTSIEGDVKGLRVWRFE